MLTDIEKITFLLMLAVFGGVTAWGFYNIYRIVRRGRPASQLFGSVSRTAFRPVPLGQGGSLTLRRRFAEHPIGAGRVSNL